MERNQAHFGRPNFRAGQEALEFLKDLSECNDLFDAEFYLLSNGTPYFFSPNIGRTARLITRVFAFANQLGLRGDYFDGIGADPAGEIGDGHVSDVRCS